MNNIHGTSSDTLIKQTLRSRQSERPPAFFSARMMQHVRREALRKEQQQERFLLMGLVVGCVALLGLVVGVVLYFELTWETPQLTAVGFYSATTVILFLMLFIEKRLRSRWQKG